MVTTSPDLQGHIVAPILAQDGFAQIERNQLGREIFRAHSLNYRVVPVDLGSAALDSVNGASGSASLRAADLLLPGLLSSAASSTPG